MAALHITEAELALDTAAVLDRVTAGFEVIIERESRPIAVLRSAKRHYRTLSEISASLPENSTAFLDPDFEADVKDFVDRHREPLTPPEWD